MSRLTLLDLRSVILDEVDGEWMTPSSVCDALGLGHGHEWIRVALVLERLANDGVLELKRPGSSTRRFRRVPPC